MYRDIKPEVRQRGSLVSPGTECIIAQVFVLTVSIAMVCALLFVYVWKNIGFDVRGDVKVFDFGLCKDLDPRLKNKEGSGYRLTGRAGSLPYSK